MVTAFVDSSALYALCDADDRMHAPARAALVRLAEAGAALVTHPLVVAESSALVQRRLGGDALRMLHRRLLPAVDLVWPDAAELAAATVELLLEPTGPSLVDRVSFEVMRGRGLAVAFAFDRHFADAGFAPA